MKKKEEIGGDVVTAPEEEVEKKKAKKGLSFKFRGNKKKEEPAEDIVPPYEVIEPKEEEEEPEPLVLSDELTKVADHLMMLVELMKPNETPQERELREVKEKLASLEKAK